MSGIVGVAQWDACWFALRFPLPRAVVSPGGCRPELSTSSYLPIFALQPPSYVIGSGHGRALASSRARTQTSRTSSVVRITGMFGWMVSFQQGIEKAKMLPHEDGT